MTNAQRYADKLRREGNECYLGYGDMPPPVFNRCQRRWVASFGSAKRYNCQEMLYICA